VNQGDQQEASTVEPLSAEHSEHSKSIDNGGQREGKELVKANDNHIVNSPFPATVSILVLGMVFLIFVNILPIAGLVTISSIFIIVVLIMGSNLKGYNVWEASNQTHIRIFEPNFASRIHKRILRFHI
jgi:hypothetical protein